MCEHELKQDIQIDEDEMVKALRRSGYIIEYRAAQLLEQQGWDATPNYAYPDPTTGVTRELDLIANYRQLLDNDLGYVQAILVGECVNNPQPLAVFLRPPGIAGVDAYALRTSGNLRYCMDKPDGLEEYIMNAVDAKNWHHCCGQPFASQFCSFVKKKQTGPWMAFHEHSHFECFNAIYHAQTHLHNYRVDAIRSGSIGSTVRLDIYYPCLILQGKFVKIDLSQGHLPVEMIARSIYRRGVIEDEINDVFFTDILIEQELGNHSELIKSEIDKVVRYLNDHEEGARATLKAHASEMKACHVKREMSERMGVDLPAWPPFAL